MKSWWVELSADWSWTDPHLLIALITAFVTALIPLVVWRLGRKQEARNVALIAAQADSLQKQEATLNRQRRDALIGIVNESRDHTHLGLLWREIEEFYEPARTLLRSHFRANVFVSLPGYWDGHRVDEQLDSQAIADYVAGLERRYEQPSPGQPYPGLLKFIEAARRSGAGVNDGAIVQLVCGPTADIQRPGHNFYRELVQVLPEAASGLICQVEDIGYEVRGGLRLNVLTGSLFGIVDAEMGRLRFSGARADYARSAIRSDLPTSLASLLMRDNLRSFDRWNLDGSTEPVSATVAWLIRVVGWLAGEDDHLAMRMIESLAPAIASVPEQDRGWGIDDQHVQQGFRWMREKQPALWERHGDDLQAAADRVGPWRGGRDGANVPGLEAAGEGWEDRFGNQ